jgi:hypothetical protein
MALHHGGEFFGLGQAEGDELATALPHLGGCRRRRHGYCLSVLRSVVFLLQKEEKM